VLFVFFFQFFYFIFRLNINSIKNIIELVLVYDPNYGFDMLSRNVQVVIFFYCLIHFLSLNFFLKKYNFYKPSVKILWC